MPTLKASKAANLSQLYDEIVAAVPELAPTPTGPDGRLEAQFVIEQAGPKALRVHLPDVDDDIMADDVMSVVVAHKRRPEKTVDPVADARALVEQKAAEGDDLAQAVLTLLG